MIRRPGLLVSVIGVFLLLLGLAISIEPKIGIDSQDQSNDINAISLSVAPLQQHIVYLIAENSVPADSVAAAETINQTIGAEVVHNWTEVQAMEVDNSIEALLIHDSAVPMVDSSWLATHYRQGLVVATFNMKLETLKNLVGDECIDGLPVFEAEADYFYVISNLLLASSPDDEALLYEAYQKTCTYADVQGVNDHVMTSHNFGTYPLSNADDFIIFYNELTAHLEGLADLKREFLR